MRNLFLLMSVLPLLTGCEDIKSSQSAKAAPGAPVASSAKNLKTVDSSVLELSRIIDEAAIDESVNPCDNFYQYACGSWIKKTELPADQTSIFKTDLQLKKTIREKLKSVLNAYQKGDFSVASTNSKLLSNYYESCINAPSEQTEAESIYKKELAAIDSIKDVSEIAPYVARLHMFDIKALFAFEVEADLLDSSNYIISLDTGGLTLPDRDSYLGKDFEDTDTLIKYQDHMTRSFQLLGSDFVSATNTAEAVKTFEVKLAEASLSAKDRANPKDLYHVFKLNDLQGVAPDFNWKQYFSALGVDPRASKIIVRSTDFLKKMNKAIRTTPIATLRAYLKWQLNEEFAWYINDKYNAESFKFWDAYLNGQSQDLPREEVCLNAFEGSMAEALGEVYVRSAYDTKTNAQIEHMIENTKLAFHTSLDQLPWLDPISRLEAHNKISQLSVKVGYPSTFKSLDGLKIEPRASFLKNIISARVYDSRRMIQKLGTKADTSEWTVATQSLDSFYNHQRNEVTLPAGVLFPPNFDLAAGDAANYGSIGTTIAYEISRAIALDGSYFDAKGNYKEWWSKGTKKSFAETAQCLVDQANGYSVAVSKPLNPSETEPVFIRGEDTLEKNIADQAGGVLAFEAFKQSFAEQNRSPSKKENQTFFLSYAQSWCTKNTAESLRRQLDYSDEPPAEFRVNGVLANISEFQNSFACSEPTRMSPPKANRCEVWSINSTDDTQKKLIGTVQIKRKD